jgi:hypothetical protein
MREIVVLPAPDGEERTISSPRRWREVASLGVGSMTVLASGEAHSSRNGAAKRWNAASHKIPLEMVRRTLYCAVQQEKFGGKFDG